MASEIHDATVVSVVWHRRVVEAIELLLDRVDASPIRYGLDPFVFVAVCQYPSLCINISLSERGRWLDAELNAVFIKCFSAK